jgi:hypothetical protein
MLIAEWQTDCFSNTRSTIEAPAQIRCSTRSERRDIDHSWLIQTCLFRAARAEEWSSPKTDRRLNMTRSNNETRELNIGELDAVSGGMPFFGMNCSLNQNNRIGGIVNSLNSIPLIGGALGAIATAIGQAYCG